LNEPFDQGVLFFLAIITYVCDPLRPLKMLRNGSNGSFREAAPQRLAERPSLALGRKRLLFESARGPAKSRAFPVREHLGERQLSQVKA
jgi:hypothetical protein